MEFIIQMSMLTRGKSIHLFISLLCMLNIVLHLFCWFWCWVAVEGTLHMQGFHCMTLLCHCKFISSAPVICSWAAVKLQTVLPSSNSELWVFLVTKNVITCTLIVLTVNHKLYIYIYIYLFIYLLFGMMSLFLGNIWNYSSNVIVEFL